MAKNKFAVLVFAAACVGVAATAAVSANLSRRVLSSAEASGDDSLRGLFDSNSVVGSTRAVYLPGYGVVFSAEMDVAPGSTPNPFRRSFTRQEIAEIKQTKKERIAKLRERMKSLMVRYADSVSIADSENIAMAVTLYYSKIEDTEAMPRQIVMWAPRGLLKSGNGPAIATNLKVQELF